MDTAVKASEIAAEMAGTEAKSETTDPKEQRKYAFEFRYQGKFKLYVGRFTNQILTPNQKIQVGTIRANITGRVPWSSLDPYTQNMAERISHMTISLTKRPDWARELGDILEEDVIHKLYEEVTAHEETFQRPREDQEASEGAGTSTNGGAPVMGPGEEGA